MSTLPARSPSPSRRVAPIMLLGVAVCIGLHVRLSQLHERGLRAEIRLESRARLELLRSSWLRSLEALHAAVVYLEQNPELSREQFARLVAPAIARSSEVQALEWIPRVTLAERARYEAAAQRDGYADFHFSELGADGRVQSAAARDEYFPVYYAEPPAKNLPALGLDLGAHPQRRSALDRARDLGLPSASRAVRLAQETEAGELGLLVFAPVRDLHGAGALRGFGLLVLRIRDFVAPAFASMGADGLDVEVVDAAQPELQLYVHGRAAQRGMELSERANFELAGRSWQLRFTATPGFLARHGTHEPQLYPLAALCLAVLIAAFSARDLRRTQHLQAEIEIRERAQAEAAQARQAQTQFLANLSHEIRTPLNAIIGYSQILQRSDRDEALRAEALQAIVHGGHHLLSLVDEVIDLSKIEAGHVALQPGDFNLAALISGLSFMFRSRCEKKGLQLRIEGLGAHPWWVRGDEGKLRQVLINLLGNAVKFTERGEVRLRLVPEAEHRFRFEVIDSGIGITADEQARVFGEFYQSDPSRTGEGAGLGLAISSRLVALMGGRLQLRSSEGWGSNFHFTLSFAPPLAILASQAHAHHPRLQLASGARCKALVVDDLAVNRNVLGHMLQAIGCEVHAAASGGEALERAAELQPDVVFLDVLMPGLDGIETARTLRRSGDVSAKLVAFSASALESQRAECLAAGFDAFIPKPFRAERIHDCLAQLLGLPFAAGSSTPSAPLDLANLQLPAALVSQIREAAQSYQVTRLRAALEKLEGIGPGHAQLAARLRACTARYDMSGVLALVTEGGCAA